MVDAVTSQTLFDGSKRTVIKLTNVSDGTGEGTVKKVDVSELSPATTKVKITKLIFTTDGMAVQILWDATANVLAHTVPKDQTGCLDFTSFGGIRNNAGTGVTGDILFTTTGHTAGDSYSIILILEKE